MKPRSLFSNYRSRKTYSFNKIMLTETAVSWRKSKLISQMYLKHSPESTIRACLLYCSLWPKLLKFRVIREKSRIFWTLLNNWSISKWRQVHLKRILSKEEFLAIIMIERELNKTMNSWKLKSRTCREDSRLLKLDTRNSSLTWPPGNNMFLIKKLKLRTPSRLVMIKFLNTPKELSKTTITLT